MEFFVLNWVERSIFDDEFDDIFAVDYESFLMDEEPNYDLFKFDDLCSTIDCLIASTSESTSESDSPLTSLELKPLPDFLKCLFLGTDESLLMIIGSDLDRG